MTYTINNWNIRYIARFRGISCGIAKRTENRERRSSKTGSKRTRRPVGKSGLMTKTVGGVVSGLWLFPENLCLQRLCQKLEFFASSATAQHHLESQKSTHWTIALNISGKEKLSELSHRFTKPFASPFPALSLNQ